MSKHHLRIIAIAVLAVVAIFTIAQAQSVLTQEEVLCEVLPRGCNFNGCEDTNGFCIKLNPSQTGCLCSYVPV